jgi:hypothetical protein
MITLITSVFKGDEYIKFYLENIIKCNNYSKCEHLIFNIKKSNSEKTIRLMNNYSIKYNNIKLINVIKDPGLYEIWNTAIKQAKYKYILSSNIDDIILDDYLNITYNYLENNPSINLVCSSVYVSNKKNTISKNKIWFYTKSVVDNNIKLLCNRKYDFYSKHKIKCLNKIQNKKKYILSNNKIEAYYNYFDKYDLITLKNNKLYSHNTPHCCPVWRKSLHSKFGYFNEKKYGPYADYEFWLRCMDDSTLYGFIPKPYIVYYINPVSHNRVNKNNHIIENIYEKYYNINNYNLTNIPKIIHQTWKIKNVKTYSNGIGYESQSKWKTTHPDYKYILWTDDDIHKFINKNKKYKECFSKLNKFIKKIDFFRYVILYEYGGIYSDLDFIPNKSFLNKYLHYDFIGYQAYRSSNYYKQNNKTDYINKSKHNYEWVLGQSFFGCTKNHIGLKDLIDNIILDKDNKEIPLLHTGPEKINQIFKTNRHFNNIKTYIFPIEQISNSDITTDNTLGQHYQLRSW